MMKVMNIINEVISADEKPALLLGNGINMFGGEMGSSWSNLLGELALKHGLKLSDNEVSEMSNTEFFDLLDLSKPVEDRSSLSEQFCHVMYGWQPNTHHRNIVEWAQRYQRPIVTVNFDENLSTSIDAKFFLGGGGFTDYYPWSSYFSDHKIDIPHEEFAICHLACSWDDEVFTEYSTRFDTLHGCGATKSFVDLWRSRAASVRQARQ
jgi:hypothetical protein